MRELNYWLKRRVLFSQATLYKHKFKIFFIILVFFSIWLASLFIGEIITNLFKYLLSSISTFEGNTHRGIKRAIVCGFQILVFFLFVRYYEKRPFKSLGFFTMQGIKFYLVSMLVGIAAITSITFVLILIDAVQIQRIDYNISPIAICLIVFGWIVQSASEEIAFRGWLIPTLGKNSTPVVAVLLTSCMFGVIHLFSSGVTVLSFLNIILSGVFFAAYAIYSNNIWGVCGLHFSWNLSLGNIFGFPVSGFSSNGETFFRIKQVGKDIFTGGSFGPEGGLIITIMLSIGIVILAFIIFMKYKSDKTVRKCFE